MSTATASATLSLRLPVQADAGTPIAYSFTASRLARNAALVIQRQVGTAHRWRTVAHLSRSNSGSGQLPALNLGKYMLRLAAIAKHGPTGTSRSVAVAVYGKVPYSTLIPRSGDFYNGTYNLPTRTFSYVDRLNVGYSTAINAANNDCRAIHLDFAYGNFGNAPAATGTLTVIQESADPMSVTASSETGSSLDAAVVPGQSWSMTAAGTGSGASGTLFFLNGYGNCTSTNSLLSTGF